MARRFALRWGARVFLLAEQLAALLHAIRKLRERRENVRLLPRVPIPENILLTEDIVEALDGADLLVSAVPTVYLRATLERIAMSVPATAPRFISAMGP